MAIAMAGTDVRNTLDRWTIIVREKIGVTCMNLL